MPDFLLIAYVLLLAALVVYAVFASRSILRRRKGPLHIAAVLLVLSPLEALVFRPLSFRYHIPTPGRYIVSHFLVPAEPSFYWFIPQVLFAGFVDVACCYGIIRVLAAVVSRFRRKYDPAGPGVRA